MVSDEYIRKLEAVANAAAWCMPDIADNVQAANKEYMEGSIPNGAFQHILTRQRQLHQALYEAGWTEKHPIFDVYLKPKEKNESD